MGPIIFCDIETGGLEPEHPIIQIGAVGYDNLNAPRIERATFQCKIAFEEATADPEALAINHYDRAAWAAQAVPERVAMQRFADFCRGFASVRKVSRRTGNPYFVARLSGYNISFDFDRILAACQRNHIFLPADFITPDVYQLVIWCAETGLLPALENLKLETVCQYLRIQLSQAHDALEDARACAKLALILTQRLMP